MTNKFASFLVAPNAVVGDRFTQDHSRSYRDERGQQVETFTTLIEVVSVGEHRLEYKVVETTNIVNPYKEFSTITKGEIAGFAFNRDLTAGRFVAVK